MRCAELSVLLPRSANCFYKVVLCVVMVKVGAAVTVAEIITPVRAETDIGGTEPKFLARESSVLENLISMQAL